MEIEFDEAKDAANRAKHGVSLVLGRVVIEMAVTTVADLRSDYGEQRYVSFGTVDNRLYVCVFTYRGDACRIISVRKANSREQERYG